MSDFSVSGVVAASASRATVIFARSNSAEGQVTTTVLTAGNSGGTSGDAFDSITGSGITFDSTHVRSGSMAYQAAGGNYYAVWNVPAYISAVYMRGFFYFAALPTVLTDLLYTYGDAGTHASYLAFNGVNNHWAVYNAAGAPTYGTTTPTTGVWYRLELQFTYGAVATAVVGRIYDASGTLLETVTAAASGTITTPQATRLGQVGGSNATAFWMDDFAVSADQTWVGASPPKTAVTAAVTVAGAVAAASSAAPAGTVIGSASVSGVVAASGSACSAGTVTVAVAGAVAGASSAAPAGTVGTGPAGAVAVAASQAPAGSVSGAAVTGGAVAASASAAPAGSVRWDYVIAGAVAAAGSVAPAGGVQWDVTATGVVAVGTSQASTGTVSAASITQGTVAASTGSAPAGLTSIAVPGTVAGPASTAPAGLISVGVGGLVAASTNLAPAGSVIWSQNVGGAVAASLSIAPAGTVTWGLDIPGTAALSATIAPAGKIFSVQKPIQLTTGTARSTWRTGPARSTWSTGRGQIG